MSLNDVDEKVQGLFSPFQTMSTVINGASKDVTEIAIKATTIQSNINNLMSTIQPFDNLSSCDLPLCNVLNAINDFEECNDPMCKSLKTAKDTIVSGKLNCESNDYLCNTIKDISEIGNVSCTTNPNNFLCKIMTTLQSTITNIITGLIGQYQSIIFGTVLTLFIVFFLMFVMVAYILFIKPFVSKG